MEVTLFDIEFVQTLKLEIIERKTSILYKLSMKSKSFVKLNSAFLFLSLSLCLHLPFLLLHLLCFVWNFNMFTVFHRNGDWFWYQTEFSSLFLAFLSIAFKMTGFYGFSHGYMVLISSHSTNTKWLSFTTNRIESNQSFGLHSFDTRYHFVFFRIYLIGYTMLQKSVIALVPNWLQANQ